MTRGLVIASCLSILVACTSETPPYQRTIYTFGTLASISIYDVPRETAIEAADDIELALARLNRDWYAWGDGELGELNRTLATTTSARVSNDLGTLIREALRLSDASEGLFNPTVGSLVELWGFHEAGDDTGARPSATAIEARQQLISIALDGQGETMEITASASGAVIDLGGIAKGAALSLCRDLLAKHSVKRALVDLGGDLIALTPNDAEPFDIGVRDPRGEGAVAVIRAGAGEAVVTSGDYERFFNEDSERYHHIIDPATGYPSEAAASVTVISRDPVRADAAATAMMVGGVAQFEALAAALDIELATLMTVDGTIIHTDGMAERIDWLGDRRSTP